MLYTSRKYINLTVALISLILVVNTFAGCDKATDFPENNFEETLFSEAEEILVLENTDSKTETAFAYTINSQLEGKSVPEIMNMSIKCNENELLFIEWLEAQGMSVIKYSFVDLDSDGNSEMILWLTKESNEYLGYVILREENETVYFYLLYYRQFYSLKNDGTFSYSGGVSDNGIRKITFSGVTYTMNDIAYSESLDNNISYFIEGISVSKDEYSMYLKKQEEKADAVWNVLISDD